MARMPTLSLLLLLAASPAARAAAADPVTVVACAPGYPGSSAEAEPAMKAFAAAVESAAGWPAGSVTAEYAATEQAGLARLRARDAALAIVPLPFVAQHGDALGLSPRLQVEQRGVGLTETWSLVAKKGRVHAPADLASFTVLSTAGYAPGFVRAAPGAWGRVPEAAKVQFTPQILSALRRASAGEDVAVLLDGPQSASLSTLPFAAELEVVARSEPLPSMLLCTVRDRLAPKRWAALSAALEKLPSTADGAAALEGLRMARFVPLDAKAVKEARRRAGAPAK